MAGKKGDKRRQDVAELRSLDLATLREKLAAEREALMRARFQHATATLENTSELKWLRRQIARIATVITEKEESA